MALPLSRNTTYAPSAQVKSADLNDIQDQIIDIWGKVVAAGEIVISASDAQIQAVAAGANVYNAVNDEITMGTAQHRANFPIPLPVGHRILNITYSFFGGNTNAKNCTLYRKSGTPGTAATIESTIAPTDSGEATATDSAINYTIATGVRIFAQFQAAAASTTDRVSQIKVTYDIP